MIKNSTDFRNSRMIFHRFKAPQRDDLIHKDVPKRCFFVLGRNLKLLFGKPQSIDKGGDVRHDFRKSVKISGALSAFLKIVKSLFRFVNRHIKH